MRNASQAPLMHAPRSVTAFLAISRLRDGLTTFFERLRDDLCLELFLRVHLLQPAVFFFELFHARHHGYIHAAVLGPPFVKGTDLSRWSEQQIKAVAHTLNTRPGKTLGWKTPAEALNEYLKSARQPSVATTG